MLAVFPEAAIISIVVFVLTLLFSKYVSLSSIFAGLFFPFGVYYLSETLVPTMMIFAVFVPILLIATHQRNIERLVRGDENKVSLKKEEIISFFCLHIQLAIYICNRFGLVA